MEASSSSSFVVEWVGWTEADDWWYQCEWRQCGSRCQDLPSLRAHLLLVHLPFFHSSPSSSSPCSIRGCSLSPSSLSCPRRHLLAHVFHASRQHLGLRHLRSLPSPPFQLSPCLHRPPSSSLPFSGVALVCRWHFCQRSFDEVQSFVDHVGDHVSLMDGGDRVDGLYPCLWTGCHQRFSKKSGIRNHVAHHSGDKPFACPFCGIFFANATKLQDHAIRKTDSSQLKCFLCQKTFPTERLLREHGRRHVKNYKCPVCEMTVETPSDLRDHIKKRHSQCRQYRCDKCDKAFFQNSDLVRHLRTHEAVYPFMCTFCSRAFKWKKQLKAHLRSHDPAIDRFTYLCHLCPEKFTGGFKLSQHLMRAHGIQVPSGHARFQYKKCADGYLRLQTERYESEKLATQIEALQRGDSSVQVTTQNTTTLLVAAHHWNVTAE